MRKLLTKCFNWIFPTKQGTKPKIAAWGIFYEDVLQEFGYTQEATKAIAEEGYGDLNVKVEPIISLSVYEALSAECKKLHEQLQNTIDQSTPLEPIPDDPKWSRGIQLDAVVKERDSLQAECETLLSKTEVTIGVGDGNGNLFVHGDYDSIKQVQALIFENEVLRRDAERYRWLCEPKEWPDEVDAAIDCGNKVLIDEAIDAYCNQGGEV